MMPGYYRFFFPLLQLTQQIWRRDNRGVNLVPHQPWGLGFSGLASSLYKNQWAAVGFSSLLSWVHGMSSSSSNFHQLWVLKHQVRRGRRRREEEEGGLAVDLFPIEIFTV